MLRKFLKQKNSSVQEQQLNEYEQFDNKPVYTYTNNVIADWKDRAKTEQQHIYIVDGYNVRFVAEHITEGDKALIISIAQSEKYAMMFESKIPYIYRMYFADCLGTKERLSASDAISLWKFLDKTIREYRLIIINCNAGESRSVAAGMAVSEYYNIPITYTHAPRPNKWVQICMRESRKYIDSQQKVFLDEKSVKRYYKEVQKNTECWVMFNYAKNRNCQWLLPGFVRILPQTMLDMIRLNDLDYGYGVNIPFKEIGNKYTIEVYA